jgi:hypothetical protein
MYGHTWKQKSLQIDRNSTFAELIWPYLIFLKKIWKKTGRTTHSESGIYIFDIHWDQHQRKLLLETFNSSTLVIHSDYSATYGIKNKNRVNSAIDTHLQQEVLVCSHSPHTCQMSETYEFFKTILGISGETRKKVKCKLTFNVRLRCIVQFYWVSCQIPVIGQNLARWKF